jgi:hypothetical protein
MLNQVFYQLVLRAAFVQEAVLIVGSLVPGA